MSGDISIRQEKVYLVSHKSKVHVDPNCRYLRNRDDYRRVPLDRLPEWRRDLCSWCEGYLEREQSGVSLEKESCKRCGKGTKTEFCDECYAKVEREKARREL